MKNKARIAPKISACRKLSDLFNVPYKESYEKPYATRETTEGSSQNIISNHYLMTSSRKNRHGNEAEAKFKKKLYFSSRVEPGF